MLYLDNGYLNIPYVLGYKMPFTFVIGGRGTGKTYGALKYAIENKLNIALIRRTQTQIDML